MNELPNTVGFHRGNYREVFAVLRQHQECEYTLYIRGKASITIQLTVAQGRLYCRAAGLNEAHDFGDFRDFCHIVQEFEMRVLIQFV